MLCDAYVLSLLHFVNSTTFTLRDATFCSSIGEAGNRHHGLLRGPAELTECLDLKLEQIIRSEEGYTIIHTGDLTRHRPSSWCLRLDDIRKQAGSVPEQSEQPAGYILGQGVVVHREEPLWYADQPVHGQVHG